MFKGTRIRIHGMGVTDVWFSLLNNDHRREYPAVTLYLKNPWKKFFLNSFSNPFQRNVPTLPDFFSLVKTDEG